ncbi:unnamed protein product, partial [Ilex paraguariensis]
KCNSRLPTFASCLPPYTFESLLSCISDFSEESLASSPTPLFKQRAQAMLDVTWYLVFRLPSIFTAPEAKEFRKLYHLSNALTIWIPSIDEPCNFLLRWEVCFFENTFEMGLRLPIHLAIDGHSLTLNELSRVCQLAVAKAAPFSSLIITPFQEGRVRCCHFLAEAPTWRLIVVIIRFISSEMGLTIVELEFLMGKASLEKQFFMVEKEQDELRAENARLTEEVSILK